MEPRQVWGTQFSGRRQRATDAKRNPGKLGYTTKRRTRNTREASPRGSFLRLEKAGARVTKMKDLQVAKKNLRVAKKNLRVAKSNVRVTKTN